MKRIIYQTPEGGLAVIVPSYECGLDINQIAEKDVPSGTPHKIIDASDIPTDRTFRSAWEYLSTGIHINIEKAKDIWRNKWREARKPLLEQLDVEFMRAIEQGDATAQLEIIAKKQELRDVTKTPLPDDLNGIKAIWPAILAV